MVEKKIDKKIIKKITGAGVSIKDDDEDKVIEIPCHLNPKVIFTYVIDENVRYYMRNDIIQLNLILADLSNPPNNKQISEIIKLLGIARRVKFNAIVDTNEGTSYRLLKTLSMENDTDYHKYQGSRRDQVTDDIERDLKNYLKRPVADLFKELLIRYHVKDTFYEALWRYTTVIKYIVKTILAKHSCTFPQLEQKYGTTFRYPRLHSEDDEIEKFLEQNYDIEKMIKVIYKKNITIDSPFTKKLEIPEEMPKVKVVKKRDKPEVEYLANLVMETRIAFLPALQNAESMYNDLAFKLVRILKNKVYPVFSIINADK